MLEYRRSIIGNWPGRKIIPSGDYFITGDFNQCNGLTVAWLETDRCACRNIEAVSMGSDAVEGELGVCFDEMVVRPNLCTNQSKPPNTTPKNIPV